MFRKSMSYSFIIYEMALTWKWVILFIFFLFLNIGEPILMNFHLAIIGFYNTSPSFFMLDILIFLFFIVSPVLNTPLQSNIWTKFSKDQFPLLSNYLAIGLLIGTYIFLSLTAVLTLNRLFDAPFSMSITDMGHTLMSSDFLGLNAFYLSFLVILIKILYFFFIYQICQFFALIIKNKRYAILLGFSINLVIYLMLTYNYEKYLSLVSFGEMSTNTKQLSFYGFSFLFWIVANGILVLLNFNAVSLKKQQLFYLIYHKIRMVFSWKTVFLWFIIGLCMDIMSLAIYQPETMPGLIECRLSGENSFFITKIMYMGWLFFISLTWLNGYYDQYRNQGLFTSIRLSGNIKLIFNLIYLLLIPLIFSIITTFQLAVTFYIGGVSLDINQLIIGYIEQTSVLCLIIICGAILRYWVDERISFILPNLILMSILILVPNSGFYLSSFNNVILLGFSSLVYFSISIIKGGYIYDLRSR